MESPRWSSGDGEAAAAASGRLRCDCGGDFDGGDDGFYYCSACGAQSQDVFDAICDHIDIHGDAGEGALYSVFHRKSQPSQNKNSNVDQILKNLSQNPANGVKKDEAAEAERQKAYGFSTDEISVPQDFGNQGRGPDSRVLRLRYVQGLQVMLQLQCEDLVEKFGVSPMICGLAGTIWLRYVAASRVFDEGWAGKAITDSKEAMEGASSCDGEEDLKSSKKHVNDKYRLQRHSKPGYRDIYLWLFSLRRTIPVHSTLDICYLVCYLAREAILPTDISKWALEGKLPYLAAFVDMDKYVGSPPKSCPLSSRLLFRPIQVVGSWQLEASAGSIAQSIGLRVPSVNFYAVACRYLKELSLPVEKILLHACHLYEWSIPADLWLSSNMYRLPTHACVMSILVVSLKVLYNIQGQGTWERSLSNLSKCALHNQEFQKCSDPKLEKGDDGKDCHEATDSPVKSSSCMQDSEFNTKDLLLILEAAYDKISNTHDYSKDLRSYLKYCKDVAFAGRPTSYEEERLIERLWDVYDKPEDSNTREDITEDSDLKEKRPRDVTPNITSPSSKKPRGESQGNSMYTEDREKPTNKDVCGCSCTTARNDAIEKMKHDMEENGFHYLPPRAHRRTDSYLQYKRRMVDGKLIYAADADYYILLRACARLAQVDARIMHVGVLKLERRLDWIEKRIESSLSSLTELCGKAGSESVT